MAVPDHPILQQLCCCYRWAQLNRIIIPKDSEKTDWEVELAVVIAQGAACVRADCVFSCGGLTRTFQRRVKRAFQTEFGRGQWDQGQGPATVLPPIGPVIWCAD